MTVTADLRQTTLDLIDLAQTASGYSVLVETSRTLKTTAALHMARGSIGAHTIEYNPDLVTEPDYYVAVQCGQIISFFGSPRMRSWTWRASIVPLWACAPAQNQP